VRPPYIYNGFLVSLEVADSGEAKNSGVARNSGMMAKNSAVMVKNSAVMVKNSAVMAKNSSAARNKTAKFKMEPSVQLGKPRAQVLLLS
jgi:hypothetical protein